MNLPNSLTLARVAMSVVFVVVLSVPWPHAFGAGLVLFALASATDFLDGWIARRYNLVTDFGRLMDPLADKILVSAALVLLAAEGMLPAWFVVLILFREFLVTGVRMLALTRRTVIAADIWGKLKTIFQIVLVCVILGPMGMQELGWPAASWAGWEPVRITAFWATLAATILSGALYLRAFLAPAEVPKE